MELSLNSNHAIIWRLRVLWKNHMENGNIITEYVILKIFENKNYLANILAFSLASILYFHFSLFQYIKKCQLLTFAVLR